MSALPIFCLREVRSPSLNPGQRWRPLHLLMSTRSSTRQSELQRVCFNGNAETRGAETREGQDARAKRKGCEGEARGTVARVTVRVVTPYVNLAIWSILRSKRIGFLWRWISSAGKLSLHLPPPLLYFIFISLRSIS